MAVRTRIIRIGNSRGVRIPKHLLDQTQLENEVELDLTADGLVIRPLPHPRAGWSDQFRAMAEAGDDRLLDDDLPATDWDATEWEW
jgi:antitoxin MazE